jgi:hypothetical protein
MLCSVAQVFVVLSFRIKSEWNAASSKNQTQESSELELLGSPVVFAGSCCLALLPRCVLGNHVAQVLAVWCLRALLLLVPASE